MPRHTTGGVRGEAAASLAQVLQVAHVEIAPLARRVPIGDDRREPTLTSAEFDPLLCFVGQLQRVLSRDQLADWTRGRVADTFDRTVDVQVSRLHRRLDEGGNATAALIKTVRDAGYIPVTPVQPA